MSFSNVLRHRFFLGTALSLFFLIPTSLQARPRYRVAETAPGRVTVDGKASADEWPIDETRPMPCAIPVSGDASKYDTAAWAAFDGTTLYLLVQVKVAEDKPLVMGGRWGGRDGFELAYRDARKDSNPIVSSLCYPDGTFEGQSVSAPQAAPKSVMEEAMTYRAAVDKGLWTAEMSIPLAKVGIPPTGLQTLNFNLNIRRMCDTTWMVWSRTRGPVWAVDTAGRLLFGDAEEPEDEAEFLVQQMSSSWWFRADPESLGLKEGWSTAEIGDKWSETCIDHRRGWGMPGYRDYVGWSWLRQTVSLPPDVQAAERIWLMLPAVDEQCEVYLDGKKLTEHTADSTGLPPGRLWNDPILIDLSQAWGDRSSTREIALHVLAYSNSGGLRKPTFLIGGGKQDLAAAATCSQLIDMGFLRPLSQDLRMAEIPDLPPHPAPQTLGSRIQRTMALLATSSPLMRHRVKILFYGQSITAGMHWPQISNSLRQRFPYAIIDTENRAIGGFTAPSLCRTAVSDLYATDADLVIFHDYGGESTGELERMLCRLRQTSTAEVMIYTHTIAWTDNPKGLERRTQGDSNSAAFNRYLAQKYNCELVEARDEWRQFLDLHGLGINEYMGDKVHSNVHPNAEGHTLLAALCLRHFQFNPHHPGGWTDNVRWVEARGALDETYSEIELRGAWESDAYGIVARDGECVLTLPFYGTRVDLVPHPDHVSGSFSMAIDGKSPEEFPELFACTKPDGIRPGDSWPVFKRITLPNDRSPTPQTWTATVTHCDMEAKTFSYSLEGSVTGSDGEGSKNADFVSNSGQIRIAARDCFLIWPLTYRKMECPENLKVTWKVYPRFGQPVGLGSATGRNVDRRIPLFRGLRNGRHILTLTWCGDAPAGIKALIVHRPPLD